MKLTIKEQIALNRYALGGAEAMRTETYHVDCKTVQSLFKKNLMNKNGLTTTGQKIANPQGQIH